MEYSFDQLDQKVKEIELEASAVLASEDMKLLQVAIVDQEDIYSYVMKVKTMQQIFQEKQKTNSGMAEFALYWPKTQKMVSSSSIYGSTGIKEKKVFIAESPLYEISSGKKTYFAYTEKEKVDILNKLEGKKYKIQRSKGLGENEPDMMWQTTMNPETRRLILVMPEEVEKTALMFDLLLGDNLSGRKEYIETDGYKYIDLTELS